MGADQGFYEFRRQLEYKCEWYGCDLIVVNRFYPSTKTCSSCGYVKDMPLNLRTYDCPECGLSLDRDLNASINLRDAVGQDPWMPVDEQPPTVGTLHATSVQQEVNMTIVT